MKPSPKPRPDHMAAIGDTIKDSVVFPFTCVIAVMWIYDEINEPSAVHICLFIIATLWASTAAYKALYRRFNLSEDESRMVFLRRMFVEIREQLWIIACIHGSAVRNRFLRKKAKTILTIRRE